MNALRPMILAVSFVFAGIAPICADEIQWRPSYKDAHEESLKSGKPIFMEFSGETCYWCKRLEKDTLNTADVAKLINERFIPVKVDVAVEADLARAVAVQALPTLFILAPDRTILNRYEGYAEPPAILQFLRHGLERVPQPPPAEKPDEKQDN